MFPPHSFLLDKMEVLYHELLFLGSEESALPRPQHDGCDELPQFLGTQGPEGFILGQETDHLLDQLCIRLIFIRIEIDIKNLLKHGEGDQRIDFHIGDKLSELCMDLLQDESIGVFVYLRGYHHLSLSPRRLGQDHLLLLSHHRHYKGLPPSSRCLKVLVVSLHTFIYHQSSSSFCCNCIL